MKTANTLLTSIASAVMAIGFSTSSDVRAEAAIHTFDDGSVLQMFDDGSMMTFDPASGYVFATAAPDDATQIAAVESDEGSAQMEAATGARDEGLTDTAALDAGESVGGTSGSVERTIGGGSMGGHPQVEAPNAVDD